MNEMLAEQVSAELEALQYTYEEAIVILKESPLHICVGIAPHTGDLATERYVNADLSLQVTASYPAEIPQLQVIHAKGMSDARIEVVMSRLQAEASSLLGELMLGSLIETARDTMTAINQPEGNCIYCLEDIVPTGWDPDRQVQGLLRLPCYHTFHRPCFSRWWQWRQTSMAQQAAQLKQDLQSAAPQRLEAEGLIPDAAGIFSVLCPVCRTLITPQDLQHMDKHARPASEKAPLSAPLHSATSLTAEEMQLVKSQQQIRARQFAQQQSQGSIVSDRYGTSIESLSNPDQPSQTGTHSQEGQAQAEQQYLSGNQTESQHDVFQQTVGGTTHDHHRRARGGRYRGRNSSGHGRSHHYDSRKHSMQQTKQS